MTPSCRGIRAVKSSYIVGGPARGESPGPWLRGSQPSARTAGYRGPRWRLPFSES